MLLQSRASSRRSTPVTTRALAVLTSAACLAFVPTIADAAPGNPGQPRYGAGAPGAGDPYFPQAGNGGIDVQHYDLDLRYDLPAAAPAPLEGQLQGTATITLVATQDLDQFNLDLRGLTASTVTVNGKKASFTQESNELVISPRPKLKTGQTATVVVTYGGTTTRPTDIEGSLYGWVTTRDGAIVTSQPDGAATWFPNSDHPTDKASFHFTIDVPEGSVAVANGTLESQESADGRTVYVWDAPDLMASYLATATIGNFELSSYTTDSGVPIIDAVDKTLAPSASANLAYTNEMMTFYEGIFGPYPFVAYGAIVDNDSVGYALETQTRSVFSRSAGESTVAHELVHQWLGNDVSVEAWADIWLNEGWATYGSWLWAEHRGVRTAQTQFDNTMAIPATNSLWTTVMADPGPTGLFSSASYTRGAATLHALRGKIGDAAFFELAQAWASTYAGSHASTADFIALAEQVSGQDLTEFFQIWAYTPSRPQTW